MEKFLNRVWATLAVGITNVQTSITLTTGHGARFGTLAAGDKIRTVFVDAANNVEVIYITGIATDTLTVLRGQDGSTARAYSAGDRIEARIGKSTMEHLVQQSGEQTFSVAAGTADAMTAAFSPTLTELKDGQALRVRAVGANTVTNPTLNPDSRGVLTIYKTGGVALALGDIVGAGHELQLTYRASPARLELNNPGISAGASSALIHAATSKATPVDADEIPLADSAASFGLKKLTWANLKASLNLIYMALVAPGASGNVLTSNGSAWTSSAPATSGVTTFNTRTGAVSLSSSDVTAALTYTPSANTHGHSGVYVGIDNGHNAVGSFCFARFGPGALIPGATVAGSLLMPCSVQDAQGSLVLSYASDTTLSGTWRLLGFMGPSWPAASLFQRIS